MWNKIIKDIGSGLNKRGIKKIIMLNEKDMIEPKEELVKDVMSILNVCVAKMNGLKKYNKINKSILLRSKIAYINIYNY